MANPNPTTEVFPQIDARLDVDGSTWNLNSITNESVVLVATTAASSTAYKIGYLAERPAELNFAASNAAPAISGFSLVTTVAAVDRATKFYVDYDRAFIIVASSVSSPVSVTYSGMGSVVRSREINNGHFGHNYLGPKTSAPSVDNEGNALVAGDQYYHSTENKMYVYNGSSWDNIAVTVGGNTVTSSEGSNLTLTTVDDHENVVIYSTTGTSGNTILLPKVRASDDNYVIAMKDKTTGETEWQLALQAPVLLGVTGELNTYENSAEDGGTLTLTGTDFGTDASLIDSIQIMKSDGTNPVSASSFGTPTGTGIPSIVFNGSETNYNTFPADTTWYIQVTKSGLASNVQSSGKSFTKDPTISAITQSVASADYNSGFTGTSGHFGSYGGPNSGGGADANTSILLNFDRGGGTDIEDSSNTGGDGYKVTASNDAIIKASPFGDGKSAMFFDGTDDYLDIGGHADFGLTAVSGNTHDYTIEFWMNPSTYALDGGSGRRIISNRNALFTKGWYFVLGTTGTIQASVAPTGGTFDLLTTKTYSTDTWIHVALVRYGSVYTLYVNGLAEVSSTNSNVVEQDTNLNIGRQTSGSGHFSGYLDEIRIVKGTAVYTSHFTVPTSRLTEITNTKLLIHSNVSDAEDGDGAVFSEVGSVNQLYPVTTTAAGASPWYDSCWNSDTGAGAYIRSGILPALTTFTIDGWFKRESGFSSSNGYLFDLRIAETPTTIVTCYINGTTLYMTQHLSNGNTLTATSAFSADTWTHLAYVRKSDATFGLFINGSQLDVTNAYGGTSSGSTSLPAGQKITINARYTNVQHFKGNLQDWRLSSAEIFTVINGLGNSNATITVPTAAPATESNTVWLSRMNTMDFEDSATTGTKHDITPSANNTSPRHTQDHKGIAPALAWPASGKATGSAGVYFDGTDDFLEFADTALLRSTHTVGSVDFWFNHNLGTSRTAHGNDQYKYPDLFAIGNTYGMMYIRGDGESPSNELAFFMYDSGRAEYLTGQTMATNTWYHILMAWDDTSGIKIYIDGTYRKDPAHTFTKKMSEIDHDTGGGSDYIKLGKGTNSDGFKGYINNFRITDVNVIADSSDPLYSSTAFSSHSNGTQYFTPPTKAYGVTGPENPSIGTIEITAATANTEDVAFSFQGSTQTNSAVLGSPTGLSIAEHGSDQKKALLTGTLDGTVGSVTNLRIQAKANDDANRLVEVNESAGVGAISFTKVAGGPGSVLFNARRYPGNTLAREITGFGFQPDLIWVKARNTTAASGLWDSVRGPTKFLKSSSTSNEGTDTNTLTEFTSDGFKAGPDSGEENINFATSTYVAWGWKAGGAPSGDFPASLTGGIGNGTLNSSSLGWNHVSNVSSVIQSVNQNSGFSITQYAGSGTDGTFPHNLGAAPDFIIVKRVAGGISDWKVKHSSHSSGQVQKLNTNDDEFLEADFGTIDTDLITVDSSFADVQASGSTYICYAWKAVDGVSAFGYYTGSGDTNHAGVDIDFFPRFVLVKGKSHSGDWLMYDAFRSGATVSGDRMSPYLSAQNTNGDGSASGDNQIELYESGGTKGFRPEQTNDGSNATGRTYIYWAFA